jgi:hypothetical protein
MGSAIAHHAVNSLYARFVHECKLLKSNSVEMGGLADSYFKYRELLKSQENRRNTILKIFGILGHLSPDVSEKTAKSISPIPVRPNDIRDNLKLWEILELFLSTTDKATLSDFNSFLFKLDFPKASAQAVDSAVRSHPELFQEVPEGNSKFISLKAM